MLFSTVFLFALWFEPSWLGAGWGSVGEVDAASFRSASSGPEPTRSHRNTGSSQRSNMVPALSGLCINRNVGLLCDPDAMQQHGEFSRHGDDGTIPGLLASTRCQMQSRLSQ